MGAVLQRPSENDGEYSLKNYAFLSILACFVLLIALGCETASDSSSVAVTHDGSGGGSIDSGMGQLNCIPDESQWTVVKPTIETYCGLCHGDTPAFGAPYGLLDYDSLINGDVGSRSIDKLVGRMRTGDMPPVGQTSVPSDEALALLDWATCGDNAGTPMPGPNPGGFDVTRPVFEPADDPLGDAAFLEFRADNGHIPADVADQYTCFSFSGPAGGERYIRRIEPVIDDTRVLHHIVLYEVQDGPGDGLETDCGTNLSAAIYAWAPGQQPVQFVDGGLVTDSSRRYLLEIHYNNSAGYDDVADQSGVRLFHSAPEGPTIDMLTIGPDGFSLPPLSRTAIEGQCNITEPMTIIATLPHMHELGISLKSIIKRADGTEEDLITLVGWDFDSQLFYDGQGLQLQPGDQVVTECIFENTFDERRKFGPYTEDEMCFNFLFVTPPPTERRCDESGPATTYDVGQCAPIDVVDEAIEVIGTPTDVRPPEAMGGEFPTGHWRLVDYVLAFDSADIGLAVLDLEQTQLTAYGVMEMTDSGRLAIDVSGTIDAVFESGGGAIQAVGFSLAGALGELTSDSVSMPIAVDCPNSGQVDFNYTYADGQLTFFLPFNQITTGTVVATFELID
ncbi:MAG: hypothetical protein CMH52_14195 [Myxococcales bacterium]|nr:hypothetical protein [Myxococcales bacterium]